MDARGPRRASRDRNRADGDHRRQRSVTPLLLQSHITECGAACLGMVLGHFGRWVPFTELRTRCEVGRDGSTAAGLKRAAEHYGLTCTGWSAEVDPLRNMRLPMVLFWEFNHFVVLVGVDRQWFYLNDPASGRRRLSRAEFEAGFTGVVLEFGVGPDFRPGGAPSGLLRRLPDWLRGAWDGLAGAAACGLLLAALAVAIPVGVGLFVDRMQAAGEPLGEAGLLLAGALAAAGVLVYWLAWLKQRFLRRLAVRLSVIAGSRSISHLLRLPAEYFSHRLVGELTARVLSIDRIAHGLSEHFLGALLDVLMSVVLLAVMAAYDLPLALLVLSLAAGNLLVQYPIARTRSDEANALRREQGLLAGVGTLLLQQLDNLRMSAADDRLFARWAGHQARELQARQQFIELSHLVTALPGLFTMLGGAAVLALGAPRVMAGDLTLGALVTFFLLAGMFLEPVGRFAELADERKALNTDMRRLDDISETPADPGLGRRDAGSEAIATFSGRLRLTGQVELRGVTFGYNRGRPPLLEDFSLVIEPGQRIAVVGPNGSGKTALARIVAGVCRPWSGEVVFDGKPRHEIPDEVLSRSLSMVDQQVCLFSGTVRDNLTLWNPAVPDADVMAAARDACVHDDILGRPLGYAAPVDPDGRNFSGGQQQRLEIARALVGNPTVLILDEATSALDAITEARVDDALRRRGMSCLIVAHRLSTVRDCDQIVVLDKGVEVQRGAHETLMADADGLYSRLMRAERGA